METLAAWTPTTPEMEVKLLFGGHIWDMAQHADMLGKRTHELRMPLQHSLVPVEPYVTLLDEGRDVTATADRIAIFYDAILPSLAKRFDAYLAATDALLDAPSVRIIERIASEQARMISEAAALRDRLPTIGDGAEAATRFTRADVILDDIVAHRLEPVA
jgi:hypothetical protein